MNLIEGRGERERRKERRGGRGEKEIRKSEGKEEVVVVSGIDCIVVLGVAKYS